MSPRLGTLSQISVSTRRSNAKVTVLRGTLASLLITLGDNGPDLVNNWSIRNALFGSLIEVFKETHHHDRYR